MPPIAQIAAGGTTAEQLHETLAAAEVRLVLTAHPTEARRYTTVSKLGRIFALLRELDERRPGARPACADPPPDRRRRPGDVGLGRAARRLDHRARRGPRRAHLLQLDAGPGRARGLPRPRGQRSARRTRTARRAGAAAAELRLVDRRRPRRQPQRDTADDRRGARADEGLVPALPRGDDAGAGQPDHAVGPRRRRAGTAAHAARGPRAALPGRRRARAPAQPGGALPAAVQAAGGAPARDAQGLGGRLRQARRTARGPARRRRGAARAARLVRRRGRAARRHPPGRGVRLSLRAARRARELRRPPRRARRDPRDARNPGRPTRSSARRSVSSCSSARSPTAGR